MDPGRLAGAVEGLIYSGIALLPLICAAGLERPFSTPKTWLLLALSAAAGAHLALARQTDPWRAGYGWLVWLGAVSVSALTAPWASFETLLAVLAPLPLYLVVRRLPAERVARAVLWGSAALAAVACLQWAGLDPLCVAGWRPEAFGSARMRVYGTMGNPAFVAAWLCAALPLAAARREWWGAGVLIAVGAAATGSRVFLLALPAAAVVSALRGAGHRRWWLVGVPLAAAILWLSPARPLPETIEGRLYLARVAASHWREIPVFGFGPGSFRPQFAAWQADWLRDPARARSGARFVGDVDHAHNDYLEMLVEFGPVGLAVFLALCGWTVAQAWRARPAGPLDGGAWGGLAALMAVALVDFPFRRPAEWALFWILLALAGGPGTENETKEDDVCRRSCAG